MKYTKQEKDKFITFCVETQRSKEAKLSLVETWMCQLGKQFWNGAKKKFESGRKGRKLSSQG